MGGPNLPKETTPGRPVEPHVQHSGETVPAAVRAQILATEHWSLLGTRGTTWTEVMSRISIHLTVAWRPLSPDVGWAGVSDRAIPAEVAPSFRPSEGYSRESLP